MKLTERHSETEDIVPEAKGSQDLELHLAQWHYAFMAFKLEGRCAAANVVVTSIYVVFVQTDSFSDGPDMTEVFQVLRSPMTCKFSLLALQQQQNTVQPGSPVVGAGTEHWKILTTSQVAQLRSAAASSKLHSEISQKAKSSVEGFWSHVFRSSFGGLHRELAWIWICVVPVWSLTTETTLPSAAVISDHSRWCCACRFACCAAMSWFRTSQLLYFWGPWGVSSWFCQLGSVDKCSPQSSCESIVWTQPKSAISSFACSIWVSADLHKAAGNQMQVFIWLMPLQTSKTYHKHKPRTKVEFYQFHQEHVMDNSGMLHPISCTSFVSPCGQLKYMPMHVSIWVSNWIRQFWMLWLSMDYWCWIFVFVPQLHCPRPV